MKYLKTQSMALVQILKKVLKVKTMIPFRNWWDHNIIHVSEPWHMVLG